MSATKDPEVSPVFPQHVSENEMPPSYVETMGSASGSQQELPQLAYLDFMPQCLDPGDMANHMSPTYDAFSSCLLSANYWLRSNVQYSVWKCESVERKVNKGAVVDMDAMTHFDASFGFNVYVRGVRLWLTKNHEASATPQQLGTYIIVPEKKKGPTLTKNISLCGRPKIHNASRELITFDTISETVVKMNERLKEEPISGSVLNVETVTLKISEGFDSVRIDPDKSFYSEKGDQSSKAFLNIIRLYYVIGAPEKVEIGVHDVVPDITKRPQGIDKPQFMKLTDLVTKTGLWLREQKDIKLVNIQTCLARYFVALDQVTVESDASDIMDISVLTATKSLKFKRVFYLMNVKADPYSNVMLTSRLFVPVRVGESTYESMQQTMPRISAWLMATGLPIFGVESVRFLQHLGSGDGINMEKSDVSVQFGTGRTWITCIRLYFPTLYQEPPAKMLPPVATWVRPEVVPSCAIS